MEIRFLALLIVSPLLVAADAAGRVSAPRYMTVSASELDDHLNSIDLIVTARDFSPRQCMNATQIEEYLPSSVFDDIPSGSGDCQGKSFRFLDPADYYGDTPESTIEAMCGDRWGYGHPDFEVDNRGGLSPNARVTLDELDYSDPSGIPKTKYCSDARSFKFDTAGNEPVCGRSCESGTCSDCPHIKGSHVLGADTYYSWFHDEEGVNKRAGYRITLFESETEEGLFTYNSREHSPEALIAREKAKIRNETGVDYVWAEPWDSEVCNNNDFGSTDDKTQFKEFMCEGNMWGFYGPFDDLELTADHRTPNSGWPYVKWLEQFEDEGADPAMNSSVYNFGGYISSLSYGMWPFGSVPTPVRMFHLPHKLWTTSEIHTFFQLREGDIFKFFGNNDIVVAINGKVARAEEGVFGLHEFEIDLTDSSKMEELDLEIGGVYSLDVFHAERHTSGAGITITTTLTAGCNLINSPEETKQIVEANITNLEDTDESEWAFKAVGPRIEDGELLLTEVNKQYRTSYFFTKGQVNVGTGFEIQFTFMVDRGPGDTGKDDGFTLMIQRSGITNLNGGVGGWLGTRNIDQSFMLAFDWCVERQAADPEDCRKHELKTEHNVQDEVTQTSTRSKSKYVNLVPDFRDGKPHDVVVRSYVNPPWIEVIIDDDLYMRESNITIESIIGGRNAHVGFTASTSAHGMNQRIKHFRVETVDLDVTKSRLFDGPGFSPIAILEKKNPEQEPEGSSTNVPESKIAKIAADGRDEGGSGFTVQTYDFCGNRIEFGNREHLIDAKLVEMPNTALDAFKVDEEPVSSWPSPNRGNGAYFNGSSIPSEFRPSQIVDNKDGSYEVRFAPTVAALYTLHIAFADTPMCLYSYDERDVLDAQNFSACSPFPEAVNATFVPPPDDTNEEPESGIPEEAVLGLAIGFGIIGGVGGAAALFMYFKFVKKWRRDKHLIDKGKLAVAERDVDYGGTTEADVVARKLQETREAIQAERARMNGAGDKSDAIADLERQRDEIQDQLRVMKQDRIVADAIENGGKTRAAPAVPKRKPFQALRASLRLDG